MASPDGPKYDAALSFLADDEPLASKLADRLSERWEVFVFSDRQREIAGTDGVEKLTEVFRRDALLDVVLHREGWGDTPWTRLEAGAIKERQLETGFEALFVVKLDDSERPPWVPSRHIYFDMEEYGLDEVVGAIELRIREQGGDPSPETAVERARRLQREEDRRQRQRQVLHSERGVELAREALDEMLAVTRAQVEEIADSGVEISVVEKDGRDRVWAVNVRRGGLTFAWSRQWRNSLESASLVVRELDGPARFRAYAGRQPSELNVDYVDPDLDASDRLVWRIEGGPDRALSSADLVDRYLTRLIERHFGDDGDDGGPGARSVSFRV